MLLTVVRPRTRRRRRAAVVQSLLSWSPLPLMLKTIDRYVIREIVPPFLLALLIFTFILELPPVMEQLEQLVAKGVPWQTAGHIILLLMPQALGLTIPMALLVGLLIGLGRMSDGPGGGRAAGLRRQPLPAAAAGHAARGRRRGRDDVRDDRGDPGRQPEVPARSCSTILTQEGRKRHPAARVLPGFPELDAVSAGRGRPGQPGWKDLLVANTSRPDAVEDLHGPDAAASSWTR